MTNRKKSLSKKIREKQRPRSAGLIGPAVIVGAALIAVLPLLKSGPSCGADFYFHFVSWLDAQRSMLQGDLYPSWASSANFGAGEPRFVFYPPLSWMAGALLGMVLPWSGVVLAFDFLLLAATGLATRALGREFFLEGQATLAGCASIFLGAGLFNIYQRSAFAELTGGFWIPLLLLFLLRDRSAEKRLWGRAFEGTTAPLALVIAGIWLSNGPLAIMASYLLAATAMVSAVLRKTWAPIVRAVVAGSLGLALASIYLIPATWERGFANLGVAVSQKDYRIENNWLFGQSAVRISAAHDFMIELASEVAVAMFAITLVAALIAWRRGTLPGEHSWWGPLALIPVGVFVLQFPISLHIWNLAPGLRMLQFPWRWLVMMQPTLGIFFAAAVWFAAARKRIWVWAGCGLLFFVLSISAWGIGFNECREVLAALPGLAMDGQTKGKPEYSPPGLEHALVEQSVPANCEVNNLAQISVDGAQSKLVPPTQANCEGSFSEVSNLPGHKVFAGTAERAGYLILRLRSFPAWKTTVNGRETSALTEHGNGLMVVPIPQGQVTVSADWTATADVVAGRCMSALGLVFLIAFYGLERRLSLRARPNE
ncbi:MAG TPA: hypothetical protein VK716_14115 [Terracidiphilus sp.]|jgi:hypothetical protein|nr:hypothetical protein [Terracidiphilus sp.]